ncbi:MAG: ThuA domain-containing protein, partial [Actinobacteria bacterium]
MKRAAIVVVVISVVLTSCSHAAKPSATARTASLPSILVFTRTRGFHHSSIPAAIAAIKQLGQRNGFAVDASADPSLFTDARLARYKAVVFLLTTGDVLDDEQQAVFQRYIEHGGGFVGVHSATDTEYGWP